jgi:hypothetical protein
MVLDGVALDDVGAYNDPQAFWTASWEAAFITTFSIAPQASKMIMIRIKDFRPER